MTSLHPENRTSEETRLGYERVALRDGALIQSTCVYCGTRIVGSIPHSLEAIEAAHLRWCKEHQRPMAFRTNGTT
jgi:hypothetical protein